MFFLFHHTVIPLVEPTNSPRFGPHSEAYVSIPAAAANGYISFSPSSLSVSIAEPDSGFGSTVALQLSRSGAYGTATITWRVMGITTDSEDLGTSAGEDTIEDGQK